MKHSIIAALIILSTSVFADDDGQHITRQLTGSNADIRTDGAMIDNTKATGIYNYNEVVYEHIKLKQGTTHAPQTGSQVALGEDIASRKAQELAAKINALAKQKAAVEAAKNSPTWPKFAEGYCYVHNDVEVEKIATYAYLSCDFSESIGKAELVVSLVPDFYAKALVAKPLYMNLVDQNRKKQRIPIVSGAVLTQDKLSINVANIVNDRKIEKLIATGTYTTLNAATQASQLYLTDLRASRVQQSTSTTSSIGGLVTSSATNVQKPIASDYLVAGGLQVVSDLAKIIGESFVNNLPYTFKMNHDAILYADIELSDTRMLRGFDADVPNVIKKQPVFDITKGQETDQSITPVPIRAVKKVQTPPTIQ
ncbi:MAG: hypothetical protein PHT07_10680 [Paludibacter sp.]|nr:hypothetical protein [Paludibacter sp.]